MLLAKSEKVVLKTSLSSRSIALRSSLSTILRRNSSLSISPGMNEKFGVPISVAQFHFGVDEERNETLAS
jgi:hypothetical protein